MKKTGTYHICFCGALSCTSTTYTILAGVIFVHGPDYDAWTTNKITGKKFELDITGSGVKFGIVGEEYIRLVMSTAIGGAGAVCGDETAYSQQTFQSIDVYSINSSLTLGQGFHSSTDKIVVSSAEVGTRSTWSDVWFKGEVSSLTVCWCSTSANSDSTPNECTESSDFRTSVGQFGIAGPKFALTNQVESLGVSQTFADGNGGTDTTKVTSGHELSVILTSSPAFSYGDQLIVIKDEDTCGDGVESSAANGPYQLESLHSTEMGNEEYPIVNINVGAYNQFRNIVLNVPSLYKFC